MAKLICEDCGSETELSDGSTALTGIKSAEYDYRSNAELAARIHEAKYPSHNPYVHGA